MNLGGFKKIFMYKNFVTEGEVGGLRNPKESNLYDILLRDSLEFLRLIVPLKKNLIWYFWNFCEM